ncbi:MAG: SPOR domain-containing protein, partial [Pseudomonadota bacterium]|nr:SPOR domain-containing protein [Pseudomonadota bacterium]
RGFEQSGRPPVQEASVSPVPDIPDRKPQSAPQPPATVSVAMMTPLPGPESTESALSQGDAAEAAAGFPVILATAPAPAVTTLPAQEPAEDASILPPPERWSIQVGAYGSEEAGQKALVNVSKNISGLLREARPVIMTAQAGGSVIYRARLTDMDEDTARKICDRLKEAGQSCMVVSPRTRT